jgi:hypothetical protein
MNRFTQFLVSGVTSNFAEGHDRGKRCALRQEFCKEVTLS